jgi:transketolase
MKWTFQLALYELAKRDKRVILLMGDVGAGLFAKLKADMPKQYFNIGLCEQSTVSIAAGLAMSGFRPVVYTITPFLIERAFEQVKLDIHVQKMPVGLVGYSDMEAGPTHCELDARTLMSLCPNIRSMFPKTKAEVKQFVDTVNVDEPWFLCLKPESK